MFGLLKVASFLPYIFIVLLNAITDLGHKIILQNTIFKAYDGSELVILTALVNALILLPFILLFSPSGYLSDKYPKTKVIKYSAFAAVIVTIFILLSYYLGLFWLAFAFTFILAAQSAIYSPAKYGLIKTMVGNEKLALANAVVQAVTIVAILAGAVIYSVFFEHLFNGAKTPDSILQAVAPLGYLLIISSIVEFLLASYLDHIFEPVALDEKSTFAIKEYGKLGLLRSNLRLLRSHSVIWRSIIGLSIFWGVSQVVVALFGDFLKSNLGITDTVIAQGLLSISGVGIIFGSLFAGRMSKNYIDVGIVPLGVLGITLTLFLLPTLHTTVSLGIDLFLFGVAAGLFIVPLNAAIQFETPNKVLGKVLAGNNFMQNLFMFAFLILTALISYFGLPSKVMFYIITAITVAGLFYTVSQIPQSLVRYSLKLFIGLKYRLSVEGLENIDPNKGVLLLGNHISFLDWAILQMAYPKQIRFVADRAYYNRWYLKPFFKFFHAIVISNRASKSALRSVTEALDAKDSVALFPEGYISRNGHLGKFNKGFELAVKEVKDVMIVPFYLRGLWENDFSFASKKLKRSGSRDISVTFGKPLPKSATAQEVKKAVFDLSIKSWKDYAQTLPSIQKAWLTKAKERNLHIAVADSTGVELSSHKFITATFLMAKRLKPLLKSQQNIGVILPTSAGGYLGNMALFTLDKTVVNLNYSSAPGSLEHAVALADIQTIVTSKLFLSRLKQKGFDLDFLLNEVDIIYLEDLKAQIGKLASLAMFLTVKMLPASLLSLLFMRSAHIDDTAVILFSSGSEGQPKGIELTHKNIMGNIKQTLTLVNPTDEDVVLGTLPIFHSFGLTVTMLLPLIESVPVVCHPDPTDGLAIGKLAAKYQATFLFATATFYRLYANNKKIHPLMFKDIRMAVAGAEKLSPEIRELFKKRFGKELYEGYGATETTPVASVNIPDVLILEDFHIQVGTKEGTVGLPLPGTSFKIVDPQSFKELNINEDGMILIGGTQIMKGYIKQPERSASVIKEIGGERWYVTGDKGHIDEDGFLTIVDRYSRFAKLGGEMVSLGFIESQIAKVVEEGSAIAVTAIADSKKGEAIVLLLEGEMELETLKSNIKSLKLNPLFIPSRYHKVEQIPRLGSGKIDLKGLKTYAQQLQN